MNDTKTTDDQTTDEYPDRSILGVTIPGALAMEADQLILEVAEMRATLDPLLARAMDLTDRIEAVGVEVIAEVEGIISDSGEMSEVSDSIHALVDELTERRRMASVLRRLGDTISGIGGA